MNRVEKFVNKFKSLHPAEMENCFLNGNCYYFAIILKNRFPDAVIKYMIIDNHFVTEINNRLYDVRGDVTEQCTVSDLIKWDDMKNYDELLYRRIIRDCIKWEE